MSIHESSGVRDRIPNIEEVILPNQADKERKFNSSSYHFDKKMAREKALNPAEQSPFNFFLTEQQESLMDRWADGSPCQSYPQGLG